MNTNHSSARPTHEYQPTIIESRLLVERLAIQLAFLNSELKRSWIDFKSDPATFVRRSRRDLFRYLKGCVTTPNVVTACLTAIFTVACLVEFALWIEKKVPTDQEAGLIETAELVMLNVAPTHESGFGIDGPGRVGIHRGKGEGSDAIPKPAGGGGGGGNRNPRPEQVGELPPPSIIPAAIPIAPPINPPALPAAGIDIDPALWTDLKAPVYGDPRSTSKTPSKGPGEGEGIGSNRGTGVGEGDGAGYGRGKDRNTGSGEGMNGCCGDGSGREGLRGGGSGYTFRSPEVDQRARLVFKPEPQYTEEARRNQITGTVMLRVVFSSSGEVVQIRAVRSLPFGLTERAIAAARQIKFVPAMKGGQPVSVHMQLEYNFNLY